MQNTNCVCLLCLVGGPAPEEVAAYWLTLYWCLYSVNRNGGARGIDLNGIGREEVFYLPKECIPFLKCDTFVAF